MLPRTIDKGRATLANQCGEYHYNCPMDQRLFRFLGIEADALRKQLATGKTDDEIFKWIMANSSTRPDLIQVLAWSAYQEQRTPSDPESRAFFNKLQPQAAAHRDDISTWFDLLDIDDFVSFGGRA